jgi:hypothetical protein
MIGIFLKIRGRLFYPGFLFSDPEGQPDHQVEGTFLLSMDKADIQ